MSKSNIFYDHWLKRDGAIYKALAFMGHDERINYLHKFIKDCEYCINTNHKDKKFKKEIVRINKRSIKFYNKLIDYIRKNPNIPVHKGFKSYYHYLTNNDENKIKKLKEYENL
tara:strand:- start:154 stop:492 length:339 start_codon:yes stop_codon:yes gene_type:complete